MAWVTAHQIHRGTDSQFYKSKHIRRECQLGYTLQYASNTAEQAAMYEENKAH